MGSSSGTSFGAPRAAAPPAFVPAVGPMPGAGRSATHLYPSLAAAVPDCPSAAYVEELMRVTALLHDVGHGPFCHFFDDNFLNRFHVTHEIIGRHIVVEELGGLR